jgi:hypothetical protein
LLLHHIQASNDRDGALLGLSETAYKIVLQEPHGCLRIPTKECRSYGEAFRLKREKPVFERLPDALALVQGASVEEEALAPLFSLEARVKQTGAQVSVQGEIQLAAVAFLEVMLALRPTKGAEQANSAKIALLVRTRDKDEEGILLAMTGESR